MDALRGVSLSVAPGEASKSWAVAGEVLEALAETGLDRTDTIARPVSSVVPGATGSPGR